MATWKVTLFAYLRERHGNSVSVEAEPNAGAILDALARSGVNVSACRLAAGNEFVSSDSPVAEECEVALIPPVSGG